MKFSLMPQSEFKQESLGQQMRRVWRENKGNWLLLTGLLVSTLAWAVGYFDLLPEFKGVRRPSSSSWSGGKSLTVHVEGCAGNEGQVIAMLYDAMAFGESSVPMRLEALSISDEKAEWIVSNLAYGKYAVYAFQDLDADEMVDPGVERQGITLTSTTVPGAGQDGFNFSSAAFEFSPGTTEVVVQLQP